MAGSLAGITLRLALIAGTMSGAQLQTYLGTPANFATLVTLINSRASAKMLLESSNAMTAFNSAALALQAMTKSSVFIATASNSAAGLYNVLNQPNMLVAFSSILQAMIVSGQSKLKRYIYTSSGTYAAPATGVYAYSVACVGGGGGGGSGWVGGGGGNGGGSAQTVATGTTVAPLIGTHVVTVGAGGMGGQMATGSPGGASSFGTICSALGGQGNIGGAAGTPTGSFATIAEKQLDKSPWLAAALNISGSNGGAPGNAGGGVNGGGAAAGGGGAGLGDGLYLSNATAGGGGGGASPNGGGGGATVGGGSLGGKYGAGGGAGAGPSGSSYYGGYGSQGFVVLFVIEN